MNKPKVLCIKENERLLELIIEVRSRTKNCKFYKTIIRTSNARFSKIAILELIK